jgi:hypothetical protein
MATVYEINKGIGRSIEFKGVKAQYIIYLAIGLVLLLLLFAILYGACHFKIFYCLGLVGGGGAGFVVLIQRLSNKYGEHGLSKIIAYRSLPSAVVSRSRKIFIHLKNQANAEK